MTKTTGAGATTDLDRERRLAALDDRARKLLQGEAIKKRFLDHLDNQAEGENDDKKEHDRGKDQGYRDPVGERTDRSRRRGVKESGGAPAVPTKGTDEQE